MAWELLQTFAWFVLVYSVSFTLTAAWLRRRDIRLIWWQVLVPGANALLVYEFAGRSRAEGITALAFLVAIPLLGALFLTRLGGQLARKTGRTALVGYVLTLPGLAFLGFPILAITARATRAKVDSL